MLLWRTTYLYLFAFLARHSNIFKLFSQPEHQKDGTQAPQPSSGLLVAWENGTLQRFLGMAPSLFLLSFDDWIKLCCLPPFEVASLTKFVELPKVRSDQDAALRSPWPCNRCACSVIKSNVSVIVRRPQGLIIKTLMRGGCITRIRHYILIILTGEVGFVVNRMGRNSSDTNLSILPQLLRLYWDDLRAIMEW